MMLNWLLVAVGGFLGAIARLGLNVWVNRRFPAILPRATLTINLSGSLLLGFLAGANWGDTIYLLAGTGFMGAYTTFSTFNVENVQLAVKGKWKVLGMYMGASYVGGILLAFAGYISGAAVNG